MMKLLCFVFGLYFGSFLHVMAYRIPRGYYLIPKRSVCENCNKELTWKELIPIFSYLIQGGRCTKCKHNISISHPLSEFIFAILLLVLYVNFGINLHFIFMFLFTASLFVLSISDIYYYLLPNQFMLFLLVLIFIWKLQIPGASVIDGLTSMIFSILFLGSLLYLTNGGMGLGDYKLLIILAYFFEIYLFIKLLLLSSFFALIFFYILFLQNKLKKESYIYFGPFISIAAYLLLFLNY